MAADVRKIIDNLLKFYDFHNKIVISVGAGGGQFIEYARNAQHVIAIDNDQEALNRLDNALQDLQLKDKFTLINSDFNNVNKKGDIYYLNFAFMR